MNTYTKDAIKECLDNCAEEIITSIEIGIDIPDYDDIFEAAIELGKKKNLWDYHTVFSEGAKWAIREMKKKNRIKIEKEDE